jgi:hypothetical protein|nr:MAG TPA_asm: hypothetical protein [Caudoviricetes sp.]
MKEEKKEELFSSPRWKNYQPVEVLKTKVKRKKEDEKNTEEFIKFIDEKIKKEEDAKNK